MAITDILPWRQLVSEERPAETIEAATESAEPKFDNCWVDCEREIKEVDIGGIKFRLRSITVGEERRIADELAIELKMTDVKEGDVPAILKLGDFTRRMILNVGAALGMWKIYGSEGWSDPRPVTPENVEALKGGVLSQLWVQYVTYFRSI